MVLLGVLGLLFLAGGAWGYSTRNGAPTCDGQTMEHGDICEVTNHGVTTNKTYEDMQSDSATGSIIAMIAGGVLILVSVIGAIRIANQKKAVVAGSMPYVPGQQFPPQPGQAAPYGQQPYGQPSDSQSYGQPGYPAQSGQYPPAPGQYPPPPASMQPPR